MIEEAIAVEAIAIATTYCKLLLVNFKMLAAIDRSQWRQQILRRPPVATTADRKPGDDDQSLVYFDWQQHWEAVRPLFERTDVRFAAAQGVQGRRGCKYCAEYFPNRKPGVNEGAGYYERWPISSTDGCEGKLFPLLLSHDGQDVGGDGSQKTELAFSWMPDAMAAEMILEESVRRDDASSNDENFDDDWEAERKTQEQCKRWLTNELDDARLLYGGDRLWHPYMALTFKLAQILAPSGAILELRVRPLSKSSYLASLPAERRNNTLMEWWWYGKVDWTHGPPDAIGNFQQVEWYNDADCVDVRNNVVYTLDPVYFTPDAPPAEEHVGDKVLVRKWVKDGGIPPFVVGWLRFRKDLPLEVVRLVQSHLLGRDVMVIPHWLGYADATETNWKGMRTRPVTEVRCDCDYILNGHTSDCDTEQTIEKELASAINSSYGMKESTSWFFGTPLSQEQIKCHAEKLLLEQKELVGKVFGAEHHGQLIDKVKERVSMGGHLSLSCSTYFR